MSLPGKVTRVRFRRNYSRKTYNTFIAPLLEREFLVWSVGKYTASRVTLSDGSRSIVRFEVRPRGWY